MIKRLQCVCVLYRYKIVLLESNSISYKWHLLEHLSSSALAEGCIEVRSCDCAFKSVGSGRRDTFPFQWCKMAKTHWPTLRDYYYLPRHKLFARKVRNCKDKRETTELNKTVEKRQWNWFDGFCACIYICYLRMTYVGGSCSKSWDRIESHYEYTWAPTVSSSRTYMHSFSHCQVSGQATKIRKKGRNIYV